MMTRDQTQTVLDALTTEYIDRDGNVTFDLVKAIAILQAALAEPSEAVAWLFEQSTDIFFLLSKDEVTLDDKEKLTPLFTHPAPSKLEPLTELTDEEATHLWISTAKQVPQCGHHLHFARAILAAAREKAK